MSEQNQSAGIHGLLLFAQYIGGTFYCMLHLIIDPGIDPVFASWVAASLYIFKGILDAKAKY